MAWSVPTAAEFKAAYPEFAAVADAIVQRALDRHDELIDDSWPSQARFTTGAMLYTAHQLAAGGYGADAAGHVPGVGVKREKAGDREVEYVSAGGGTTAVAGLGRTAYGQDLAGLIRRTKGGPLVPTLPASECF